MEACFNKPPRRITDSTEAHCSACGSVIYSELLIAETDDSGEMQHRREVRGNYRQATDSDGHGIGPLIPFCPCKE